MVKRISPSQSPTPTPVVSTGATRVIQLGNRFIRPQVAPLVRGPTGATTVRVATPTTSNIIVRAAGAGHAAAAGTSVVQWPSQPLTSPQLQNLFQRPRAPVHHHHHRIQGPIVRTILVPRQAANATLAASSSSGTNLSVTTSQPHQLQQSNAVNTPLPNIQLPSEPVPISPQVIKLFSHCTTHYSQFFTTSHCLKITQNVAFEFLNFGIFRQFLSY